MSGAKRLKVNNETYVNDPIRFRTVVQDLHENGYVVMPTKINVPDNVFNNVIRQTEKKEYTIFNHNENNKRNDYKRKQRPLEVKSKYMRAFMKQITDPMSQLFPELVMNDWVIIHSKPGCRDQAAHTDYVPDIEFIHDEKVPINILVCLQDGTKLNAWPGSQGLNVCDLTLPNGQTVWEHLIEDNTSCPEQIHRQVVQLEKGDVLLFRGDFVHAGAGYDTDNYRLHCYMDSPHVKRKSNVTWTIHDDGSAFIRDLIKTD